MDNPSKSFRIFWQALTSIAWFLVLYLSSHESEIPIILARYSVKYFIFLSFFLSLAVILSIANLESVLKKIYSSRHALLLSFASLLLSLALTEAYVRIADLFGISYYAANTRSQLSSKIPDPELIFKLRPSVERITRSGNVVRINEFGLRDDPIQPKKKSEFRILFLGDSVTYGSGVTQEKIFTVRLQRILATRLGRPIRVINTGVGGYNTVQEYLYLKKEGLSFQPDLVLLMYVINDIEINPKGPYDPRSARSFKNKSPGKVAILLLKRSWLYRLAHHAYSHGWYWSKPKSYESVNESPGWKASMEALKDIVDLCKKNRIPLVIFFHRMGVGRYSSALLEDVRNVVAPVPVRDVAKWFPPKRVKQYVNSVVDGHPNSEGHKIIAENIGAYLLKQNVFHNTSKSALINLPVR